MIDLSKIEKYIPSEKESEFILDSYSDFEDCRELKEEPQPILGDINLKSFWDRSNYDYNVLVEEGDINDPVKQYSSSVTRDKANAFISSLTSQLIIPTVIAQNSEQKIDRIVSKVSRSLLEWAHINDGRPSSSGHKKTIDYVHKMVVEGTVHVQDDVVDGRLESQLVPNEEIFIPNFWQSDLQKQPYLFRVQDNIHYLEAQRKYGDLKNFKYVMPGRYENWNISGEPLFKEYGDGITEDDEVQVVYIWKDINPKDFKKYKVPAKRKKAKLFNILINGVLMFPVDNLSPYEDGNYPMSKEVFEMFSKAEYYWGNSMPNKAHRDKEFLDGWKTLIRHKAKLSAIPPILTFNGQYLDSDIFIPGNVIKAPSGMKPDDIAEVPGINLGGVSNSDMAVLQDAKQEIEEGNISSQGAGKANKGVGTATESIILEQNEQKILGAFGLRVAFLIEQRTFPILKRLYQFLPKQKIKMIAIPNQALGEGKTGTLEVIFENTGKMTRDQKKTISANILKEEKAAAKMGENKKIVFINPKILEELDMYIMATSEVKPKPTDATRRAEAMEKYQLYIQDPGFNAQSVRRNLVRAMGDDEQDMIVEQQPQQQMMQQQEEINPENSAQRQRGQEKANMRNTMTPQRINV